MNQLKYLTEEELEQVKQLQDKINQSQTHDETKKYITEITLIIERARVRTMAEKQSN